MVSDIKDRVRDHILRHEMITKGEHVCVAVSGGADSMCLLFLLHGLSASMGFTLSAIHVEHGIRGQASLDDMDYVIEECGKLGVELKTVRIDARAVSGRTGTTLEEAARNERYRIFEGTDADKIALAHHMDDQTETFLFNAVRGTGIRGLRGMLPVRGKYIRPLLCITRKQVEEYCKTTGIEYRTDATNEDTDISRNRIRQTVMPELIRINGQAAAHISEVSEEISEVEEYLEGITEQAFGDCVRGSEDLQYNGLEIDLDRLDRLPDIVASRVIKEVLVRVSGKPKDISRIHINILKDLAKGRSGRHADLIYGIKAFKDFRRLVIRKAVGYELPDGISHQEKSACGEPDISFVLIDADVSERMKNTGKINEPDRYTKYLDYATIGNVSVLEIRHRMPGDQISIKGGNKKLKDLLIEEKIPADKRDTMYFVTKGHEIVWIPATGRIGERFKVTEKTINILKMEMKHG
ncbi:MAG: tRNA lysidine(34) synthetase TilS [Lachnospiraceae bacterium]|nr:tRNA lysidine(34) synthetase TilS [Lachnospiraceae bacterium]